MTVRCSGSDARRSAWLHSFAFRAPGAYSNEMEKARNTDAFRSASPGASARAVELDCVAVAEVEIGTFAEGSKRVTPAESSRSGRRLSPSTSTNAIPLCCRKSQRLDNIQSFVRAHHKMPLYMTVKKPSTRIVRHVTKLESISAKPV